MSDLRTAAQQALEALEDLADCGTEAWSEQRPCVQIGREAITALRAALAQQAEPQGCATEEDCTKQPWCRIRGECQRKQAEPVEPHRWEGDNNIESPFNACMHKTYCMTLKQAEPLNLADPAVQKRLATQWGYVPAAQAEPDLSRCPRCNGPADNGFDRSIPPSPYLCTKCMAEPVTTEDDEPVLVVEKEPDYWSGGHFYQGSKPHIDPTKVWSLPIGTKLYTAPPQRKPLPKHDQHCVDVPGYGLTAVRLVRAVERAHGIKE